MNPIKQNKRNNCGQTCLLMAIGLTNDDIDIVNESVGKKGKTSAKDLMAGLEYFGFQEIKSIKTKSVDRFNTGIIRIRGEKGWGGHWLILDIMNILDPATGKVYTRDQFVDDYLKAFDFRVVSIITWR